MILAARCMAAETSKGIVTCACALDIHLHTTSPHIISGGHVLILLTLRPITRLSIHEINSKIFAPKLKLSTTMSFDGWIVILRTSLTSQHGNRRGRRKWLNDGGTNNVVAGSAIEKLCECATEDSLADRGSVVRAARCLLGSVTKVLLLADIVVVKQLLLAKKKVARSLGRLESVSNFTEFVKAFSQFGAEMVELAHLTGDRQVSDSVSFQSLPGFFRFDPNQIFCLKRISLAN